MGPWSSFCLMGPWSSFCLMGPWSSGLSSVLLFYSVIFNRAGSILFSALLLTIHEVSLHGDTFLMKRSSLYREQVLPNRNNLVFHGQTLLPQKWSICGSCRWNKILYWRSGSLKGEESFCFLRGKSFSQCRKYQIPSSKNFQILLGHSLICQ
jgi:hypothetical protein